MTRNQSKRWITMNEKNQKHLRQNHSSSYLDNAYFDSRVSFSGSLHKYHEIIKQQLHESPSNVDPKTNVRRGASALLLFLLPNFHLRLLNSFYRSGETSRANPL